MTYILKKGSRWRNKHTDEIVTIRNVLSRSPGGAIEYPIVEYIPSERSFLETLSGHSPWFKLIDWETHWIFVDGGS